MMLRTVCRLVTAADWLGKNSHLTSMQVPLWVRYSSSSLQQYTYIHTCICTGNLPQMLLLTTTHFCLHHCTGMVLLDEDLQSADMALLGGIMHWRPSVLDSIWGDKHITSIMNYMIWMEYVMLIKVLGAYCGWLCTMAILWGCIALYITIDVQTPLSWRMCKSHT